MDPLGLKSACPIASRDRRRRSSHRSSQKWLSRPGRHRNATRKAASASLADEPTSSPWHGRRNLRATTLSYSDSPAQRTGLAGCKRDLGSCSGNTADVSVLVSYLMAGFASRPSFAGHADDSASDRHPLTFKLDHPMGAGQLPLMKRIFYAS